MRLASVLEKFSQYCKPRKNITVLRHKFFTYRQQEGQNFHYFVTELKKLISECEFETLYDSLIKERASVNMPAKFLSQMRRSIYTRF